jgi:hypothetical protein
MRIFLAGASGVNVCRDDERVPNGHFTRAAGWPPRHWDDRRRLTAAPL